MLTSVDNVGCLLHMLVFLTDIIYSHTSTADVYKKDTGTRPHIVVEPRQLTHVHPGMMIILSCQAAGSPIPYITWYKDGVLLPGNSTRVAVFSSGYLLLSEATPEDTGQYYCVALNSAGKDSSKAIIVVTDHKSGCADETTDGLHRFEDIQACKGQWQGHVKRGRRLCARGWKVCSSRDVPVLKMLTWDDVTQISGCYALNAENDVNQCSRCHRGDTMAGVGNQCGRIHRNQRACLAQGRMDVYRHKDKISDGCHYKAGYVSGVLCCKNRKKNKAWKWPRCSPKCDNGGSCIAYNRCECLHGYKGAWCQHAVCPGGCIPHATCIKPGVCRCNDGYTGEKCKKTRDTCLFPCLNGGRCKGGKCKCPLLYRGPYCQHKVKWRPPTKSDNLDN